jgi:hypothetical protein
MTLEQMGARAAPNFTPAHDGETVEIAGVVSMPPFHFTGYTLLAIEDGKYGAVLNVKSGDGRLDELHPGDQIEVDGTVGALAGLVVVHPARIAVVRHVRPPAAEPVTAENLQGFRYLGRLVVTEGRVIETDDTTGGPYILISSGRGPFRLFLPRAGGAQGVSFQQARVGDKVRATGIALQYCPRPPFNTRFEVLLADQGAVVRTERGWFIPPFVLAAATSVVLFIGFFLWSRERRLRHQRERLRKTFQLAEDILSAGSAEAILKTITEALPGVLGVTRVQLYVHNRASKTLEAVTDGSAAVSISLSSPPDGTPAGGGGLLPLPDAAGDSRHRAQPVSHCFQGRRPNAEIAAVRADDGAGGRDRGSGIGPGRPCEGFQAR